MQEQNPQDLSSWETATPQEPTTLKELDLLATEIVAARDNYEQKKRASAEAHGQLEELEKKMMQLLKANGRTSFDAEGVGKFYFVAKEVYTVPKEISLKNKLFNYIKEKYGPDALMNMVSINHNTLNSWANKETEASADPIPGLEAPTMAEVFYFRRK